MNMIDLLWLFTGLFSLPSLNIGDYSIWEILLFAVLVIIGLAIVIFLIKIFLIFLPAAIIAFVIWFLTGSLFWAGVAFLVISVLSVLRKI